MKKLHLLPFMLFAEVFQSKYKQIWSIDDMSVTQTPTLKDQFSKRKPQGYKKHLRKKKK